MFTAPRKPWNQASIEGANSVFSRKFWNRFEFGSLKEIDQGLFYFNRSYERYTAYQKPKRLVRPKRFVPKVYFIRKVYEHPGTKRGYIDILKEQILLPKAYINMFVLAEWRLKSDKLMLYFEDNKRAIKIKTLPFALNPVVKNKVY